MRAFEDLPLDWQERITELADRAPPLSPRMRERVQMLFRGAAEDEVDQVDLSRVGATIYRAGSLDRIPLRHAGPALGHDLYAAGLRSPEQWRQWIDAAYVESRAVVHPGDLGYPIFTVKAQIGDRHEEVWFEQFGDNEAGIYYPSER